MSPDEAADLAARILATTHDGDTEWERLCIAADRERVASDLAVFRETEGHVGLLSWINQHAANGLRRTAALYGVTE